MAELDSLIGCKISLISHQDIRYDGTLFSINQNESSIALKDVQVFGTEDRVTDPAKKVAPSTAQIPFVTFPGSEIKDLYVHEAAATEAAAAPPAPPAATTASKVESKSRTNTTRDSRPHVESVAPPQPPQDRPRYEQNREQNRYKRDAPPREQHHHQQQQPAQQQQPQQQQTQQPPAQNRSNVGTGSHLLKLRERKASGGTHEPTVDATHQDFDFEHGNNLFNKEETVKDGGEDAGGKKYAKDDFFDNLSNDVSEKEFGRKTRFTASEERQLNQDTFGAIALQSNYRRSGRGRGNYGGGRGGGRGGGGGYYNNNNSGGRGRGGGYGYGNGGYGTGRGGGGGTGGGAPRAATAN